MNDPIKLAILNRVLANLAPLTQDNPQTARIVERKASLLETSEISPAIFVVAYPERVIEEDTVCYTLEFGLVIQLFFTPGRDPGEATDRFEAAVQTALEADDQLGEFINWLKYESNNPFVIEEGGTDGGTIMQYTVQYRRARGAPHKTYA